MGKLVTLVTITYGSYLYFIPILALIAGYFPLLILCKRKGGKFTYTFVLSMYWANFALHFLKQFLPGYIEKLPAGLYTSTALNWCALFIVAAPFLLISKKKVFLDYLFYMGVISSLLAYFFPTNPMIEDLATAKGIAETSRYYLCHAPLLYGGCLLLASGYHKLDYHRYFWAPFLIWCALGISYLNCILFNIPFHNYDWSEALNRDNNWVNGSFALGPGTSFDKVLGGVYPYLINYVQIYYVGDTLYFTPVLWLLPFIMAIGVIVFPFLCLPFEYSHIKEDRLKKKALLEGKGD
ncbi:MAG: hypothetical protein K6B65_05320 [Bacilli bacterium]|nr:hypothetical protein [Bacilli bacterium]